ncbi:hypothetical protein V5E97_10205 [Singulisphaera sp. Ch08]|uniref:Uncharacterized protein n=1 Tax=Singulisphaera sp. Ch08 TaxID=3120278 RepID=A0AAU7CML2_9BACT
MSWEITTVEPDASRVAISDGSAAETLHFPGTTDEAGLRVLAGVECAQRNFDALSETTDG